MRWASFLLGTAILAAGIVLTVKNPWGPSPWDALHLAIARRTGWSLGTSNISVSLTVLMISLRLGGRWTVRWGTLINTVFVGVFVDLYNNVLGLPDPTSTLTGALYLGVGTFFMSLGSVLYTRAGLGAGSRDGLTLVLSQRLPYTVGKIRLALDGCACTIGWLLGGSVGLATAFIVLAMGPISDLLFRWIGRGQLPGSVRIPERRQA